MSHEIYFIYLFVYIFFFACYVERAVVQPPNLFWHQNHLRNELTNVFFVLKQEILSENVISGLDNAQYRWIRKKNFPQTKAPNKGTLSHCKSLVSGTPCRVLHHYTSKRRRESVEDVLIREYHLLSISASTPRVIPTALPHARLCSHHNNPWTDGALLGNRVTATG